MPLTAHSCIVLVLRTGNCVCGIPVSHVCEVMRPLSTEPLAGATDGVLGLSMIRGKPTPVVDLAAVLGNFSATQAESPRFVTVLAGGRTIALLADSVSNLREIDATNFESLPPLWQSEHPPAVTAIGMLDRELLLVLDSMRMLPEDFPEITEMRSEP